MKKNCLRITIVILVITVLIFALIFYLNWKNNSSPEPTYELTKYVVNESDLSIFLDNPSGLSHIYLSAGCNSLSLFFYFGLKNEGNNTITGSVGIMPNTTLVTKALQRINPTNIPKFWQEDMTFYSLNASNLRFERANTTGLNSWVNLTDYCLNKTPIKNVVLTANFSTPIGVVDENGWLRRY